jgi:hypothetical protein
MAVALKEGVELILSNPRALGMLVGTLPVTGTGTEALQRFIELYRVAVASLVGRWTPGDPNWMAADEGCRGLTKAWLDVHRPVLARDDLLLPTQATSVAWSNASHSFALLMNHARFVAVTPDAEQANVPMLLAANQQRLQPATQTLLRMVQCLLDEAVRSGEPALLQALGHIADLNYIGATLVRSTILEAVMAQQLDETRPEAARDWGLVLGQQTSKGARSLYSTPRNAGGRQLLEAMLTTGSGRIAERILSMLNEATLRDVFQPAQAVTRNLLVKSGTNAAIDTVCQRMGQTQDLDLYLARSALAHFDKVSSEAVLHFMTAGMTKEPGADGHVFLTQLVYRVLALDDLDEHQVAMLDLPVFQHQVFSLNTGPLATCLARAPSVAAIRHCLARVPVKKVQALAPLALQRCAKGRDVRSAYSRTKLCEHLVFWETVCGHFAPSTVAAKVKQASQHANSVVQDILSRPALPPAKRSKRRAKDTPLEP